MWRVICEWQLLQEILRWSCWTEQTTWDGLLCACVDDNILGGNQTFQKLNEEITRQFDAKPRQ